MVITNWQEKVLIWEGLEDFRITLLKLFAYDVSTVNQKTLDMLFGNNFFEYSESKKDLLIKEIELQLKNQNLDPDVTETLTKQLSELRRLDNELVLKRHTHNFDYEFVLKSKPTQKNFSGFVKIVNKFNTSHRGLLSWQNDNRNPIVFLAELLKTRKVSFHINLGDADGLAIIDELDSGYRWTQSLKSNYSDLLNAEHGSIFLDKNSREISLEDGNISAAMALSKAQSLNNKGITVFENNIQLMEMFKKDLEELDFSF